MKHEPVKLAGKSFRQLNIWQKIGVIVSLALWVALMTLLVYLPFFA